MASAIQKQMSDMGSGFIRWMGKSKGRTFLVALGALALVGILFGNVIMQAKGGSSLLPSISQAWPLFVAGIPIVLLVLLGNSYIKNKMAQKVLKSIMWTAIIAMGFLAMNGLLSSFSSDIANSPLTAPYLVILGGAALWTVTSIAYWTLHKLIGWGTCTHNLFDMARKLIGIAAGVAMVYFNILAGMQSNNPDDTFFDKFFSAFVVNPLAIPMMMGGIALLMHQNEHGGSSTVQIIEMQPSRAR